MSLEALLSMCHHLVDRSVMTPCLRSLEPMTDNFQGILFFHRKCPLWLRCPANGAVVWPERWDLSWFHGPRGKGPSLDKQQVFTSVSVEIWVYVHFLAVWGLAFFAKRRWFSRWWEGSYSPDCDVLHDSTLAVRTLHHHSRKTESYCLQWKRNTCPLLPINFSFTTVLPWCLSCAF